MSDNRVISEAPFMLVYCPDKQRTQKICDEAVDGCLGVLKFIPDWFVTSKMSKKLVTALYAIMIYSMLMKILVTPYFLVMKRVFLV